MAKVNVKLWNKSASNASWNEDRPAVSIFPDKNKGNIYCRGHECTEGPKPIPIKECIIEIEEEGYGIVFEGTFKELCSKLKKKK
jgi:hypothetical protein